MRGNLRLYLVFMAVCFLFFSPMLGRDTCAAEQNPCFEDIARFCKDIGPGMAALMNCLENHENELSNECKVHEAKMLGVRVERTEQVAEKVKFRQTCMSDMGRFCNDADPAKGGMFTCLQAHESKLSIPCKESMKAIQK